MPGCWRDGLTDREWREDHEQTAVRFRLKKHRARKNVECHIDHEQTGVAGGRKYYRAKYWLAMGIPTDTTEIIFPEGTVVIFTKLPDEVRKGFDLRSEKPRAKVVTDGELTGFVFGSSGLKGYYPLLLDDSVRFIVYSLPRPRQNPFEIRGVRLEL